jgi:NADH-quinone oxidoreductase subunit C
LSDVETEPRALPGDGLREGIVDELRRRLGDHLLDSELKPNDDLWVRVATDAWKEAGEALYQMGFQYFCFLSAIDWMPSPYGRGEDDPTEPPPERTTEIRSGVTGGDTRFQVFARLTDVRHHVGITVKTDVPDDALTVDSWFAVYAGANWHERETHEMFGIDFAGHPDLRNMYLPTEFEGFPLRKDFPLLARMVKPWPGIVDVEPMPAEEAPPEDAVAGEVAPESATPDQADAGVGAAPAEDAASAAAVAHSVEEAPDHEAPPPGDAARTDSGAQQDVVAEIPDAVASTAGTAGTGARPGAAAETVDEGAPTGTAPDAGVETDETDDTAGTAPDAADPTGTVERGTLDDPERDTLSEPEPTETDVAPADGEETEGTEPS